MTKIDQHGRRGGRENPHKLVVRLPPGVERLGVMSGPRAKRVTDLYLHENALVFCQRAMEELRKLGTFESITAEAMIYGIVARYFSCFGKNNASAPLKPEKIFRGVESGLEGFQYWKALRDKAIIHNESQNTALFACVILSKNDSVQGTYMLETSGIFHDKPHLQLLHELIEHTLKYVRDRAAEAKETLKAEATAMSADDRRKLPNPVFKAPETADMFSPRAA